MKPFKVWFTGLNSPNGGEILPSGLHLTCRARCACCPLCIFQCSDTWKGHTRPRAPRSFLTLLPAALAGTALLTSIAFCYCNIWASNLQRKTSRLFREPCQVIPIPKGNEKNPKQMHTSLVLGKREGWEQHACRLLL